MIAVIETGGANLASVTNALDRLEVEWTMTRDPRTIREAEKVVMPGVGAAAHAMERLREADLTSVVPALRQPVLGICLGMQLLFARSDEGPAEGLGIIPASVRRLASPPQGILPHMGWNNVEPHEGGTPLLHGVEGAFFYFVHTYAGEMGPWVKGVCDYGNAFPAIVQKDNFFGCQFHPERSASAGATLLRNFLAL